MANSIDKCKDWTCPLRKNCFRYRVRSNRYDQKYGSWMVTNTDKGLHCSGFWDIKDYTERNLIPLKELGIVDDSHEFEGDD